MGDEENFSSRRRVTEIPSSARVGKYLTRYRLNSLASEQQMLEYDDSNYTNSENSNYDEPTFNPPSSAQPSYQYSAPNAQVPGMTLRSKTLPSRRDSTRRSSPSRNQRYSDYEQNEIPNQDNIIPHNNANLHENHTPQKKRSFFAKIVSWFIDLVFYIATSIVIFLDIQILSRLGSPFRTLFSKNHAPNGVARTGRSERSVCGTVAMIIFIASIVAITAILMASSYQKTPVSTPTFKDLPEIPSTINTEELKDILEKIVADKVKPSITIDEIKSLLKTELTPFTKEQTNQHGKLEGLDTQLNAIQTALNSLPTSASVDNLLQSKISEVQSKQNDELAKFSDTILTLQKLVLERGDTPAPQPVYDTPTVIQPDYDEIVQKVKSELTSLILESLSSEKATLRNFIRDEISKNQPSAPVGEAPIGTPQDPTKLMDLIFREEADFLNWLKENYRIEGNIERQEVLRLINEEIDKIENPSSKEIIEQEKELIQQWISEAPQNLNEEEVNKIIEKYVSIFENKIPSEDQIKSWIEENTIPAEQIITSQEQTIKDWFKDTVTESRLKLLEEWVKGTIKKEISEHDKARTPTEISSSDELVSYVQQLPTNDLVSKMIAEKLEVYTADKNGKIDFALGSNGGRILKDRTSPNYERQAESSSWLSSFRRSRSASLPAYTILHHDIHPGYCWAFAGSKGHVGVALSEKIVIRSVSVEHTPNFITRRNQSAPREFNIYGLVNETDIGSLLGTFEYDIKGNHLQTFEIKYTETPIPYPMVLFDITSNHGYKPYTCVYRFRVHGDPVYEDGEETENVVEQTEEVFSNEEV
eukprot:TRINITY_DN6108_c0_g1_i2.p1 TRINITY_DN6108_c0_g1~~TRINITY_DN6108_c0_g1_i2.p1  ORF type:complete len:816 (+),score=181.98 TRINITY_DN6108_c0_g1_i2:317-2764(+)